MDEESDGNGHGFRIASAGRCEELAPPKAVAKPVRKHLQYVRNALKPRRKDQGLATGARQLFAQASGLVIRIRSLATGPHYAQAATTPSQLAAISAFSSLPRIFTPASILSAGTVTKDRRRVLGLGLVA